mmetsp:Transcript_117705/g.327789  ORF Transcript_117705/g.327789 Transcript_117705/m.327789 type:complete len:268 (+) Transcript_117705:109-912(+)
MDRSASLPASGFDYKLPSNGIGQTGHAKRVILGTVSKDKGGYSSRINQIIRQAGKVPGPGQYLGHDDWTLSGGNAFSKLDRNYKSMNKVPAPNTYERKDIMDKHSIASKDCLSQNPRILHGAVPKGRKRSFLDQAEATAKTMPGAGHYNPGPKSCDRLDTKIKGALSWERETMKSKGRGTVEKEIAPNHYKPSFSQVEERSANYSVPKVKANNFIDKAVREKLVDLKTEIPGPGTYATHTFNDEKVSRGTRHLQLRGLTRSPLSGYF